MWDFFVNVDRIDWSALLPIWVVIIYSNTTSTSVKSGEKLNDSLYEKC